MVIGIIPFTRTKNELLYLFCYKPQVIYTTHSPFMVDSRRFDRVRIVQDMGIEREGAAPTREREGTKVFSEVLEAHEDSLFPLQGALGYEIYQTLFVGKNCLVVEGVSDLLYIQTISVILERNGREGLSPKWTITPVGGSDKVPTFVALLGSQSGLKVATLIDYQKKDAQTIENLFKKKLLKRKNVLTFADFTEGTEADIEDMFGIGFFLKLVNGEYKSDLEKTITIASLKSDHPRVLIKLGEYFKSCPLQNNAEFSHYRPARYFVDNTGNLTAKLPEDTLERFERAFSALNKLL
ncbi:MAG: hypothetical protein L3K26_05460 [Candidatus Hydrogenedentes bacterium]|nr:hypothetical protein [Candidatus Hydrogenedentota bacterium]